MIKVLVHYKQWIDSGNVHFDDILEDRSKIVEVKDILELNNMFRHITKIEVINDLTIPVSSIQLNEKQKTDFEVWCDKYNYKKTIEGVFIRKGIRFSLKEMLFKYEYNLT
jgi:ribosomal 50S subunit-recycling heat shock protein